MAEFKQEIILIYDKTNNEFRERSDEIKSVKEDFDYTYITYIGNSKTYKYISKHIIKQTLAKEINPSMLDIYIFGELQEKIEAIGDYNTCYAIIYKNSKNPLYVESHNVSIKSSPGKKILAYLSGIATHVKNNFDDEREDNLDIQGPFLATQIKKIKLSEDTVLTNYFNGNSIKTNTLPATLIYPFDVNTSQKEAIKKALGHNISIIQGPPGTGKTQSILNLIANLIYNGKSVGVVSNNNSAVENVKEKLNKNGYDFLIAHLGKKENRQNFFQNIQSNFKPDSTWSQDSKTISAYTKTLDKIGEKIDTLLQAKEELAKCKETLTQVERESKDFFNSFGYTDFPVNYDKLKKWDSQKLLHFKTIINYFPEKISLTILPYFIYFVFKYNKVFTRAIKAQGLELNLALDTSIYQKKIAELKNRISELQQFIDKSNLKKLNEEYSNISTILFKNALYQRYSKQKNPDFSLNNYQETNFEAFINRFPVILSTTHSILSSVTKPLDYIIIDESSQVDIITASLAFSSCRNVVIVGDAQQLPHIVSDDVKKVANKLINQYDISPTYDYVKNNIIVSLEQLYGNSIPKTLLREHYRCHPLIIGFCNQKYYKGQLIIMKEESESKYGNQDYPIRIFRTVKGSHEHDKSNDRQIAVIKEEVLPQCAHTNFDEIGLISPFRNQVDKITTLICKNSGMECDTIHKFQGREKKTIIFSTVSNQVNSFLDSAKLINVAVSRAIDRFIMVMPNSYKLNHGSNIGDLIRYIEHWNPYGTIESKVISYFDLLNPGGYSEILQPFKMKIKGKSKYLSENIIETLLREILNENPAYSGIDIKSDYPLYLMIQNKEGLNEREIKFCNRSHVDFLLINRCDNSFIMAIEVDGYTFHSKPKQQERDAIKNKLLSLNSIELLRLSTRGELEKDKIIEKIQNLICTI